ncbi:unnamed protein product [Linum trigynum]|uniref:Retrotransposon gag domain-containing protein n=1 Tax=Linum trigynum TaxID=586398 RepID=A0AAV2CHR4_9ROSI
MRLPVTTWDELRGLMRECFGPAYYCRELHEALQSIHQGSRSVDDYYKELEMLLLRADIREDTEATILRFLPGLNREIRQEVEMRQFIDLEEVVHLAIKVEKQLKVGTGRRFAPVVPRPISTLESAPIEALASN